MNIGYFKRKSYKNAEGADVGYVGGAIFVPSEKTCDYRITQDSKGILMEMNHALLNGYTIYDPGALFGMIEV